jgi:hypothetical protein
MTTPTTLAETWTAAQADAPIDPRATPAVQARRDYMRGAVDTLVLLHAGVPAEALRAEIADFAAIIGTEQERAG